MYTKTSSVTFGIRHWGEKDFWIWIENWKFLHLRVALFLRGVYVSFLVLKPNRRGVPQDDEGEPTERQQPRHRVEIDRLWNRNKLLF